MRTIDIDFECCNPKYGCPYCLCIRCWNNGKMPECSKIEDKPHVKHELLCKHCIKNINSICFDHYWRNLIATREIKHEKLQDREYKHKLGKEMWDQWKKKFNVER